MIACRLPGALLLALVAAAGTARAEPDYAAPGGDAVRQVDTSWTDSARSRELPLRLRLPQASGHAPVILFSHGLGGSRAGGAEWGEHWASHGFAVIHVQHPGSDEELWKGKPPGERLAALRTGIDLQQFLARIADIKFVVGELRRRQQSGDPLIAGLDVDRLGMSGHSFGAITTLYLGGQHPATNVAGLANDFSEPRFTALLAFSPGTQGGNPEAQFADFSRPALLVTGTLDGQPFPGVGVAPEQRLVPFAAMASAGNKFLLVIDQADHNYFNGTRGLRDFGTTGREAVDFASVEKRGYALVKAVSTAYWLAYLKGDAQAGRWLKEDAAAFASPAGYLKKK